jgi:hypothetical protein
MTQQRFPAADGYIALLTVLIVGAAATAIALTLLLTGVDSQRSALIDQQTAQARQLTNACAEEALQVVHDSTGYTGTNNLTLSTGSCTYTVTNTGASTRTISTSATINNVVRRTTVYVTIGASNISITSWQEVS